MASLVWWRWGDDAGGVEGRGGAERKIGSFVVRHGGDEPHTCASRCPTRPVGAESNDRDLIFWRVSYWSSLARSPPPCPPHHHRQNDPHNFGTLPAAMVAVWQIETFDNWEDIMQTNM